MMSRRIDLVVRCSSQSYLNSNALIHMKQTVFPSLMVVALLLLSTALWAESFPKVLFEDDFSGTGLKKEWGSWKSETIVRDGVMVGITPKDADHPSVNTIKLPPLSDMEVDVAFKFAGSNRFSVMFRDLDYKGSHAGHICHVAVTDKSVTLFDGKTGIFANEYYDKRKTPGGLSDAEKQAIEKTKSTQKVSLDPEQWHNLVIRIEGDVIKAWIDGELVGTLQSPGIAHPTKSNMNITTVDREVHYDNFFIRTP